jgi:hypothetical protein
MITVEPRGEIAIVVDRALGRRPMVLKTTFLALAALAVLGVDAGLEQKALMRAAGSTVTRPPVRCRSNDRRLP